MFEYHLTIRQWRPNFKKELNQNTKMFIWVQFVERKECAEKEGEKNILHTCDESQCKKKKKRATLGFPKNLGNGNLEAIVAPILTAPFPLNDSPHAFLGNSNDFKNPSKSHPYEKNGLTPQIFTTKPSNQPTGK